MILYFELKGEVNLVFCYKKTPVGLGVQYSFSDDNQKNTSVK